MTTTRISNTGESIHSTQTELYQSPHRVRTMWIRTRSKSTLNWNSSPLEELETNKVKQCSMIACKVNNNILSNYSECRQQKQQRLVLNGNGIGRKGGRRRITRNMNKILISFYAFITLLAAGKYLQFILRTPKPKSLLPQG